MNTTFYLNTSNPHKLKEFKTLFAHKGITLHTTHQDLKEINATPLQVVIHKASQLTPNTLVEDTSLHIANHHIGINIRWLLHHAATLVAEKATWTVLLAYQKHDNLIYVYQGKTHGTIVSPRGKGFGFDPIFQPQGSTKTLAQAKPNNVNARAKAIEALLQDTPIAIEPPLRHWQGPWQ